ncbi:MAG: thioredoxin domain-containing protein [Syntrophaceae bacterium]|nr:thioredoxin domain-containing protein [Syntrophaceae bacterium]
MKANRLINEKSPYLLQHAHNPVDWYPWGEEAFARAGREDKPIFLSIGYSTCHWCHVMERESFEDAEVAALLNDTFINIKVDREERPDIDAVYMKACRLMTQSGGWPLTVMMTQDLSPFFAATYIPRETRYGRVGLLDMIPQVRTLWRTKRAEVLVAADEITAALRRPESGRAGDVGEDLLHRTYRSFMMSFDATFGGFGEAPKFPSPHNLFFLLRYWKRAGEEEALRMTEQTLQNMRRGGIYDQIGFGFHRYSTDARWIVPHFEKMLYDQALTALAYLELYQATGKKEYEKTAREIFSYVLRDMTDAQGGFYSAEDADSEGQEGKFYLWTEKELRSLLSPEEADLYLSIYRHTDDGELPGMREIPAGHFIPHRATVYGEGDRDFPMAEEEGLEAIRKKLFAAREKRVHPHKDDKILTDWNGLMIAALARGAQVLDDAAYSAAALRAMHFITEKMTRADGGLWHRYREGQAAVDAHIDDYAFMVFALLELYEATLDAGHLLRALELQSRLAAFFRDGQNGGFFFTSSEAERLPVRPKELYDGAIPSGNSVSFLNALRLSRITGDADLDRQAHEIYRAFCAPAGAMPKAFTYFLCGLDFAVGPVAEVVIAGGEGLPDTQAMLAALRRHYAPNTVVIFHPDGEAETEIATIAPWIQEHSASEGRARAFVCTNFTCALPTSDPEEMIRLIDPEPAG